ncbi:phage tail protein [Paenibacillus psychroresistens]|uniref:Phage tail protein n=1 Tax=Paenibacillus psychroresistens TaxID=1778678 RepID=A0A6B8RMN8_9BACL|nr:phage tail protein [Paenibacillus psychroresistens]QGQ96646.1 phage tail protein [Paenibacillus psychroresistens]
MVTEADKKKWADHKKVVVAFRFEIEINGLVEAGFNEVSGLQVETEFEEYNEGGLNEYTHRFPKRIKYPPLVFKRGIIQSNTLWDWYQGFTLGTIKRMGGAIILNNSYGVAIGRWEFVNAYPIKWMGPTLSANKSEVAIETLEIVHNGLKAIILGK